MRAFTKGSFSMSGYSKRWMRTASCAWGLTLLAGCNEGSEVAKDAPAGAASASGSVGSGHAGGGADSVGGSASAPGSGGGEVTGADGMNGATAGGSSGADATAGSTSGPPDGATDDGATDDGATDDGTTDDGATDDSTTDDSATDDSTTDDGATDDSTTDDGATDDSATDDSAADDSATDDSATDDGTTDDGTTDDSTTSAGPSLIGDVSFSVPSQSFRDPLAVELSTGVSGAEIRYTTDGSLPNATSAPYESALAITTTTELRAQAFTGGTPSGFVSTALYVARSFDVTSNLPILLLDGYGGGKSNDKEVDLRAALMVFEPIDGTASLANLPTLASRAAYHLRGQSSSTFEQTPYRVELWDNLDQDVDHPLLGMPADGDWALIPPFYDRSLIRNPFTYSLGKDLGLEAPRTAFAEVYVNYEARALGEADYLGIYWVSELIKNNKVRTDLRQLEPTHTALPEISGGYIWKFEQYAAEEPSLVCTGADPIGGGMGGFGGPGAGTEEATCWHSLELVDPDPVNAEQQAWITQHIQEFHDALHATPIGDYGAYVDLPSFVDYFLVTELSRNMDAYVRSAFYHKDRDGKIEAGPLWDYNFAFGAGSPNVVDPRGDWQVDAGRNVNNWYLQLLTDPAFRQAVKARWQVVRQDQFSEASFDARIAELIAPLGGEALARDSAKWPMSWFIERAGRSTVPIEFPEQDTFDGQIQALKDFLAARLTRMDELITAL